MTDSSSTESRRARVEAVLERFAALRVLVVGDLLLDEYRSGEVERVSPEAPVPIVRVHDSRMELGGAGNVARGVVSLGAHCELVALVGEDREGAIAHQRIEEIGVSPSGILRTRGRPTTHKLRVVARGQQMLRLDREETGPLEREIESSIRKTIAERMDGADVVILQDYDKGLFADGLAGWTIELARSRGVPVVADPKRDLHRFRGAALVKPNLGEALAFCPGRADDFTDRRALIEKLARELLGSEIVLTRGAAGMTSLDREGRVVDVVTRAEEVFDVQGAGDTSVAVLALCRTAGAELVDACIVANAAAAVAVGKRGTATVDLAELRVRLPGTLSAFEGKL